jgi:hypothetical protein
VRSHPLTRARRGGAILFFILFAWPLVFLSGALAGDATRIISENRSVSNAVESAAVAGVQQYLPNSSRVNSSTYNTAVNRLIDTSVENGSLEVDVVSVNSRLYSNEYGGDRVSVTLTYTIPDLLFSELLSALTGSRAFGTQYSVTRSADICVPGQTAGATGGNCVRPTGR